LTEGIIDQLTGAFIPIEDSAFYAKLMQKLAKKQDALPPLHKHFEQFLQVKKDEKGFQYAPPVPAAKAIFNPMLTAYRTEVKK